MKMFGGKDMTNLGAVIESQSLWRGTEDGAVSRFEDGFAKHLGRKYVLGVSSGTSADETALAGLGLKPGDEVICPGAAPIFVSMPAVVLGCVPVFADVDPRTLIVTGETIEKAITPRAKAVMVVHLNGQPAPMKGIMAVARKHNLLVLEDCAQAFDAYCNGKKTGTIGDVACFSLQQSKHMTAGEGGIVATDDPEIYKRMVLYSNCGMPWYRYGLAAPESTPLAGLGRRGHFAMGHNYRMSELHGAVACAQLERLDKYNALRARNVKVIEKELKGVEGVELAHVYPGTVPNYWHYPIKVPEALGWSTEINYLEEVYQAMQKNRRTSVGYPLPAYVQYKPGICPLAEKHGKRFTSLSVHPTMSVAEVRAQARELKQSVRAFFAKRK